MLNTGPGRRFAKGSSQEDQILGAFGFVSHAVLFMAAGVTLGAAIGVVQGQLVSILLWLAAALCFTVRAVQVGTTTTKESLDAIFSAWFDYQKGDFQVEKYKDIARAAAALLKALAAAHKPDQPGLDDILADYFEKVVGAIFGPQKVGSDGAAVPVTCASILAEHPTAGIPDWMRPLVETLIQTLINKFILGK